MGRSLKQLGGDLGEGMEERVVAEAKEVVRHLDGLLLGGGNETVVKLDDFFDLPCLNVMWSLVSSGRFSYNDPDLQKMIRLIDSFTMDPVVGPLVGVRYDYVLESFPFSSGWSSISEVGASFPWNVSTYSEKHDPVSGENGGAGEGGKGQLY